MKLILLHTDIATMLQQKHQRRCYKIIISIFKVKRSLFSTKVTRDIWRNNSAMWFNTFANSRTKKNRKTHTLAFDL